ncbi:hypothetical protein RB653_007852 [Dictyostelium firmibasis]|uniref:Uncharacterized protein n=1 Tax=Dictyostelium firmibasis TaxID=79012 RepID=A0AAN7U588_9MYCE
MAERVKHLKPGLTNRSRSASIDMIVMDELAKNSPLYTNGSMGDVSNNNNNNNNDETSSNISASNSIQNLSLNNLNSNSVNNTISERNPDSPRFRSNTGSLQTMMMVSNGNVIGSIQSPSPPISPRAQITAPNLSKFIDQHTPPPSPKPEHLSGHLRIQQQHHSGIYRNLSFSSVNSSTSFGDFKRSTNLFQPPQNSLHQQSMPNLSLGNNNNNNSNNSESNDISMEIKDNTSGIDTSVKSFSPRKKRKKENKIIRRFRRWMTWIISSNIWLACMILSIVFVLFIDDIIGAAGSPSSNAIDYSIMAIKCAIIGFFSIDIVLNLFCFQQEYFPGTIVFWLDLISLVSIVTDVHHFENYYANLVLSITVNTRIIRICGSFIRISLISTLYNRFLRKQTLPSEGLEVEASKLGDKLIRLTTNKIVLLALAVLFATQLLVYEPDAPTQYIESTISSFEYLSSTYGLKSPEFTGVFDNYQLNNPKLLYAQISNEKIYDLSNRIDSLHERSILKYNYLNSIIWIDNSYFMKYSCILHLCLTIFVILILITINLLIVNDAHWLVINPLENVLTIVKLLSKQNSMIKQGGASIVGGFSNTINNNSNNGNSNNSSSNNNNNLVRNRVESIGNKSDTADTTSSSGIDNEEPDEADFLLGMLNDIDDSLQAAKEKVEEESIQNSILKKDIEDLYVEKYILQVHLRSIVRKINFQDPIGHYLKKRQLLLMQSSAAFNTLEQDNEDDIRFKINEDGLPDLNSIQYATIDKLIEKLTMAEAHDLKFANVFLLTYRKFLSPVELMERLTIRFCVTPTMELPEKLLASKEQVEQWRKTKQEQIRTSVFNTIKLWIGIYNWDFHDNPDLYELFNNLVNKIMPFCKMEKHATYIDSIYKRKMATYIQDPPYQIIEPLTQEEIAETMVMEDKLLFNFDISDIAIQITLMEFDLFKNIKSKEFLNLAWTHKTEKTKLSPNIVRFIEHFNSVSFWLQTCIVKSGKIKDRVAILKKVIALADVFVQLNNYYGAMEVLSSLESSAVSRLHKTWEQVPQSSIQSLQSLQKLLSPAENFKNYRERISKCGSCCIPYIGLYLSDLTFIHEGNPDYYQQTQLINFSKLREVAITINTIKQFQNIFYYYEKNQNIRSQMNFKSPGADIIWKMSLSCEQRSKQ